jgi:predicted nucleic-acid-binding Zn-ribbon protein
MMGEHMPVKKCPVCGSTFLIENAVIDSNGKVLQVTNREGYLHDYMCKACGFNWVAV